MRGFTQYPYDLALYTDWTFRWRSVGSRVGPEQGLFWESARAGLLASVLGNAGAPIVVIWPSHALDNPVVR